MMRFLEIMGNSVPSQKHRKDILYMSPPSRQMEPPQTYSFPATLLSGVPFIASSPTWCCRLRQDFLRGWLPGSLERRWCLHEPWASDLMRISGSVFPSVPAAQRVEWYRDKEVLVTLRFALDGGGKRLIPVKEWPEKGTRWSRTLYDFYLKEKSKRSFLVEESGKWYLQVAAENFRESVNAVCPHSYT